MTTRARRLLCATLALAWTAAIFWASSRSTFPSLPDALLSHDKVLHALAFAVLSALIVGASATGGSWAWRGIALGALLATAYGATDEWHQSHVPGRDSDPADLLADGLGAIAGAVIAGALLRPRGARASIGADVGDPRI